MGWKNLPYWLRGGIIAELVFIILILSSVYARFISITLTYFITQSIGIDDFLFERSIESIPLLNLPGWIFYIILFSLIFIIIGAIIGLIVGKIKSKKQKEVKIK